MVYLVDLKKKKKKTWMIILKPFFFLYSRFLFELNQVPDFAERIFCLLFQESFQESISVIDNKLNNLKMTSEVSTIRAIS